MSSFTVERIHLHTAIAPEECIARLRENIYSFWRGNDVALPLIGSAKRERFVLARNTIRIRKGVQYSVRNSSSAVARGRLIAANGMGTTLKVRFSLHPLVQIWWAILIGGFTLAFVLSWLQIVGFVDVDRTFNPLVVGLAAALTASIFYPFYLFGFWLVRRDPSYPIACLESILDAHEVIPEADIPLSRGSSMTPRGE